MSEISGEHADKIYQAMHSCDGFLFRLQEFAEREELDDQARGILLSDIAEIRSRILKWTDSLGEIAQAYRDEKRAERRSSFAAS